MSKTGSIVSQFQFRSQNNSGENDNILLISI